MVPHQPEPPGGHNHAEFQLARGVTFKEIGFRNLLAVDCEPAAGVAADHVVTGEPDDAFDVGGVASGEADPVPDAANKVQERTVATCLLYTSDAADD